MDLTTPITPKSILEQLLSGLNLGTIVGDLVDHWLGRFTHPRSQGFAQQAIAAAMVTDVVAARHFIEQAEQAHQIGH